MVLKREGKRVFVFRDVLWCWFGLFGYFVSLHISTSILPSLLPSSIRYPPSHFDRFQPLSRLIPTPQNNWKIHKNISLRPHSLFNPPTTPQTSSPSFLPPLLQPTKPANPQNNHDKIETLLEAEIEFPHHYYCDAAKRRIRTEKGKNDTVRTIHPRFPGTCCHILCPLLCFFPMYRSSSLTLFLFLSLRFLRSWPFRLHIYHDISRLTHEFKTRTAVWAKQKTRLSTRTSEYQNIRKHRWIFVSSVFRTLRPL